MDYFYPEYIKNRENPFVVIAFAKSMKIVMNVLSTVNVRKVSIVRQRKKNVYLLYVEMGFVNLLKLMKTVVTIVDA